MQCLDAISYALGSRGGIWMVQLGTYNFNHLTPWNTWKKFAGKEREVQPRIAIWGAESQTTTLGALKWLLDTVKLWAVDCLS